MAYVDQSKKAKIASALKAVMPRGWKYSLSVRNHSTIVCSVTAANFDVIKAFRANEWFKPETATHFEINPYHFAEQTDDECLAETLAAIMGALNTDNHDRSDITTDYFDVGHHVSLSFGKWDKPFKVTAPEGIAA